MGNKVRFQGTMGGIIMSELEVVGELKSPELTLCTSHEISLNTSYFR